jgi:hypothetical protein
MTLGTKLRYALVFWPFGLVIGWMAYSASKLVPCFSPNLTLYRYCDVHSTHVNLLLGTVRVVLGSIGWIISTIWILREE